MRSTRTTPQPRSGVIERLPRRYAWARRAREEPFMAQRRLHTCPTCSGSGQVTERRASKRKGEGEETVQVPCNTCDGSGQILGAPE